MFPLRLRGLMKAKYSGHKGGKMFKQLCLPFLKMRRFLLLCLEKQSGERDDCGLVCVATLPL